MIDVKLEQFLNAQAPILVTVVGIVIDDKAVIEIFADGNAKMYIGEAEIQKYIQQFEAYTQQAR